MTNYLKVSSNADAPSVQLKK